MIHADSYFHLKVILFYSILFWSILVYSILYMEASTSVMGIRQSLDNGTKIEILLKITQN